MGEAQIERVAVLGDRTAAGAATVCRSSVPDVVVGSVDEWFARNGQAVAEPAAALHGADLVVLMAGHALGSSEVEGLIARGAWVVEVIGDRFFLAGRGGEVGGDPGCRAEQVLELVAELSWELSIPLAVSLDDRLLVTS